MPFSPFGPGPSWRYEAAGAGAGDRHLAFAVESDEDVAQANNLVRNGDRTVEAAEVFPVLEVAGEDLLDLRDLGPFDGIRRVDDDGQAVGIQRSA